MQTMKWMLVLAAGMWAPAASAAAPRPADASVPGEVIVEPPTLQSLGFEWPLSGDANRNATVNIRYRARGASTWREGLPLLRLGGEETRYLVVDFVAPAMFAGSLFDLQPDTAYEITLRISDPDGV